MPATRHLLKDGSIETAQRQRKCHHNAKHHIRRGDVCLVVRNASGEGSRNYCRDCALAMLDVAADDLKLLRDALL